MSRCVGAFLRQCDNQTDAILCADCYAFIDKVLYPRTNKAAAETRPVYRKKAKAA
jgi:hypothetical protein